MAINTLFAEFKATGGEKHNIKGFVEDMTDYCVMQNWCVQNQPKNWNGQNLGKQW